MTALRHRPRPWIKLTRTQLQQQITALETARDDAIARATRYRTFVVDWLLGVANSHDLDARRIDGPTVTRTSTAPRTLTAADHRLIAEQLREAARDFEEAE